MHETKYVWYDTYGTYCALSESWTNVQHCIGKLVNNYANEQQVCGIIQELLHLLPCFEKIIGRIAVAHISKAYISTGTTW